VQQRHRHRGRTLDADLVGVSAKQRETTLRGHGFGSLSVFRPQAPAGTDSAPPGYLEFRMATSERDASKPGSAR
jgi:hypothetical protein